MAPNQKAFNVEPAHNTYIFSFKSSCTSPKILDVACVQILLTFVEWCSRHLDRWVELDPDLKCNENWSSWKVTECKTNIEPHKMGTSSYKREMYREDLHLWMLAWHQSQEDRGTLPLASPEQKPACTLPCQSSFTQSEPTRRNTFFHPFSTVARSPSPFVGSWCHHKISVAQMISEIIPTKWADKLVFLQI